jgi:hypothetical protein
MCGAGQQHGVRKLLNDSPDYPTLRLRLTIKSNHHRRLRPERADPPLHKAFLVPAKEHQCIESFLPQDLRYLWRVATAEAIQPWSTGYVLKEPMPISFEQGNIPVKVNSKTSRRLPRRRLPIGIKDGYVYRLS